MQLIGESDGNTLGGGMLSLHTKIIALHGPSILINAISRNETMVDRIDNYH